MVKKYSKSETEFPYLSTFLVFKIYFIAIILSNGLTGFFFSQFNLSTRYLLVFKDLALYLFLVYCLYFSSIKNIGKLIFPVFIFIVYFLLYILISMPIKLVEFASFRQFIVPYLFFCTGFLVFLKESDLFIYIRFVRKVVFSLLIFGMFDYIFNFWEFINLSKYFETKNILVNHLGVPYMFIEPIFGGLRRFVSIVLDPINLGHILVFYIFLLRKPKFDFLFNFGKVNLSLRMAFEFFCFLLTYCKGAFLQLLLFCLFLSRFTFFSKIVIFFFLLFALVISSKFHEGIYVHISGFIASLRTIKFFGYGIGSVGNQAALFGNFNNLGIEDSFLGSLVGQLGFLGFLFWLLPFIYIVYCIGFRSKISALFFSQLVVSAISENSFNFLSIILLFTFMGFYYSEFLLLKKIST